MTFEGQSMLDERDRAYWFSEILSLFECRDPENAHPHIVNQLLDSCDVEYQLLYEHFEQKLRNSEKSSCDALTNRSRVSETSIQGFDPIKSGSKRSSGVSVHAASRRASTAMSMAMKNPKPDVPKIPETEREMWYNRVYELMLQLKPEGATPENIDVLLDEFDGRYDDLISKLTARLPNTGLTSLPHINPEMDMLPRDANVDVVAGEPQNECLDASSREEWIARLSNFFLLHTKESSNLSSKENIAFLLDHVDGFYGNFFRFVQSEPRIAEESETMDRHDVLEAFLSSPFSYDLWHGRFRRLLQEKRPELSSDHEVAEIMVLSGEAFGQLYRKLCANYNYSPDTSKTATPHPDTPLMDPSTRLRKDPERHDPSAQPEKEEGKKERYFTSRRGSTIESTARDKKSANPETPSDTEMAATTTPKSDTLHGSEETKNPEDDGGKKRGSIIKQWTRRISRRLSLGNPSQSGRSRKNSEVLVLTPPQTPTHGRTKENPAHSAGTRRSSQVLNEEKRDQSAHRASRTSSNDLSSGRTFGQRMVDFLKGKASDSNQGQNSDDSLPSISSIDEDDITQYEQEKDKLSQQRQRAEEDEQTREEGVRRELEMVIDLRLREATEARRLEQALDRLPLSLQPLRIFRLLTFEQKVDRLLTYFRWRDPTMANRSSVVRFIREHHSRMCWRHFWAYTCETYGPEPYSLLDLNSEIEQSEHNPSETHEEQEPYSMEASVSITLTYIGFRPEQMRALSNYQRISVQEAIINDIDMNAPPPRHPVKVSAPWITDSSLVHLKLSGAVEDLRMIVEFICDKVAEKMFSTSASRQTLRKAKIHVLKDLKVIKAEVVSHIKPTHTPSAPHQMHDSARTRHSRGSSNELIHPPPSHHLGWIDLDSDSALDTRNRTPPRVPKPNFDRNEISPSPLMVKTAVMAQSAVETPKGPLTWEQQRHSALIKQRVVPRIPTLSRAMGEPWSKPNDPRFVELQLSLRSSPRHQVYGNRTRNTHEDFIQH